MPAEEKLGDGLSLLNALRRGEERSVASDRNAPATAVQLRFDDAGAYLEVVDEKGRPTEPDHRPCRGALRDLLKALGRIRRRQDHLIGWNVSAERVYLHDHEHLLWPLRNCDVLVDEGMAPISFGPGAAEIVLTLAPIPERGPDWLSSNLLLVRDGEVVGGPGTFKFINETHVIAGSTIFQIHPVGESFRQLPLFNDSIPASMLERCLSLLFSHTSGVAVRYQNYRTVFGEDLPAKTAVLFQQVDPSGALHFDLAHTLPGVPLEFVRDFDITRLALIHEAEKTIVVRNVLYGALGEERQQLSRQLTRYCKELNSTSLLYEDEGGFILGQELADLFLSRELGDLARRTVLFGAEKLRTYKVRPVHPKLKVTLGQGLDFLEGDASLEIEGERFGLWDVLAQCRKNSYVSLSDGTRAVLNTDYLAKMTRLIKKHEQGVKVSFFDLPLIEELIEQSGAQAQFPEAREVFLGFNSLASQPMAPPPIDGALRPYQMDGLKWLDYLYRHRFGGCLADDMGLGKTVQAISLLSQIYPQEKTPSLLIMPRSLLFNWQREIARFCPRLRCYAYHGADRDLDAAMEHHLVLTTYGMLRNNAEKFADRQFHFVILDESQAIKNVDTQTTKAVLLLKAQCRLALSGTPIENNLGELYSLFRFLNPAMFGSASEFNRDYALPIHEHDDKEAARELRKKIYPFILRRLKRDVAQELPEKIEQILYVDMSPEQQRLYEARRRFYYETIKRRIAEEGIHKSRFFILEALLELRQVASVPESKSDGAIRSPKREMLVESVADAVLNGHKAIVFTNFLAAIELLSQDIEERGIGCLTMTGTTRNREALVKQFQTQDDTKVFLMTLKTGGVGLNLTAADTVFIFDPWWNAAAELQAIDRTHRIGQDRTVFAYKLIARNSIEEKIVQIQQRKKDLFDAIITTDGAALKSLTEEDIDDILG